MVAIKTCISLAAELSLPWNTDLETVRDVVIAVKIEFCLALRLCQ